MTQRKPFEAEIEAVDDTAVPRDMAPSLSELWSRRTILKGLGAAGLFATTSTSLVALGACDKPAARGFNFKELARGVDQTHHVAEGYDADILIRWGDAVLVDAPAFDPQNQTADGQRRQFGYNNDYVGFVPLPYGSGASDHGLLCVNHEYTNADLMFPGLTDAMAASAEQVDVLMAAHGGTIVEIGRDAGGKWRPVPGGAYNRRITALDTEIEIAGPAAGHDRLRTAADPKGKRVIGTVNNCAGGVTPWGTYLMAEENVNIYFAGTLPDGHPEEANYKRMGIPGDKMGWARFHDRFDIGKEQNEANRFGWVVEVDPLDPAAAPRKHTALGRFKHEGCENAATKDGRLAIYMGDDQQFEYLYKFVSAAKFDTKDRAANRGLLDEGTLYVARFEQDGTGIWRPLVHGQNGLDASHGFASQADVLIEARRAADILGATPLDRPEDVQPDPLTQRIYVALTNNARRTADKVDRVNSRAKNLWGQIVEISPEDGDHGSERFSWTLLVACGDPAKPDVKAQWNEATTGDGWFACPDNLAVDGKGRLWVATDQGEKWSETSGAADGIFALQTDGNGRGTARRFFRVPVGAEMCGPCFTPDSTTLFVAVQHPAADGTEDFEGFRRASTFNDPATRWPDFAADMPPRPSVLAIREKKGGLIGG